MNWFLIDDLCRVLILLGTLYLSVRIAKRLQPSLQSIVTAAILGTLAFALYEAFSVEIAGTDDSDGRRWLMPYLCLSIPLCAWTVCILHIRTLQKVLRQKPNDMP